MLANTENVEISSGVEEDPTHPLDGSALDRLTLAMDQFTLSLLSTTRHHEQLSDFQVRSFLDTVLIIMTFACYRQQVSKALLQAGTSQKGHEHLLTLLRDQSHKETSSKGEAPLECRRPLRGRGGGKRIRSCLCQKLTVWNFSKGSFSRLPALE